MVERAGLDFDVSEFTPKKPEKQAHQEEIRAVSEAVNFRSREPVTKPTRRHRTGRNVQMNVKVKPETLALFHTISDDQGWVLGVTIEKALEALRRELGK